MKTVELISLTNDKIEDTNLVSTTVEFLIDGVFKCEFTVKRYIDDNLSIIIESKLVEVFGSILEKAYYNGIEASEQRCGVFNVNDYIDLLHLRQRSCKH